MSFLNYNTKLLDYEINDNMKFASEIVERMEEEIKPTNIELTDYEKKQEEEAVISYHQNLPLFLLFYLKFHYLSVPQSFF